MIYLRKISPVILMLSVILSTVACGGGDPEPSPNIEATVQARVEKAIQDIEEKQPTVVPTSVPSPSPIPTPTPDPTPEKSTDEVTKNASKPEVVEVDPIKFLEAVLGNKIEDAKQFIDSGVYVNSLVPEEDPTLGGAGALHIAIFVSNIEMLTLLLDNGADIDIRDGNGNPPIHLAVQMDDIQAMNLLIEKGANINATESGSGATPLDLAYESNSQNMIDRLLSIGGVSSFGNIEHKKEDTPFPTTTPIPTATPDMMAMMAQMMGGGMGNMDMGNMDMSKMMSQMGMGNDNDTDDAPSLQNLMMQNLGPWDSDSATFGDLKFDHRFASSVFDDFGMLHNQGQTDQYYNPTFEYKAPADSIVLSPISGVVTMLDWQPTTSYKQDDWDIIIAPSENSKWGVNLDHVVSIDCDRSGKNPVLCELPLTMNGEVVELGTVIEAGQVLGYVGNWPDTTNSGINGRTELTLYEYVRDGANTEGNMAVINHCPMMYLDESVAEDLKATIQELMVSFESWDGDSSTYNENEMVAPGCRYSAIREEEGVTTPVTD